METPLAAIYEICCHYRYHPIILFGLYTWMNNPESQMVAVTVRAGSKAEMALPDGTFVHLNAATNLEYDVNNSKQRLVKLSGEAFSMLPRIPIAHSR